MTYATFASNGEPIGFFHDAVHGPRTIDGEPNPACLIPDDAIQVTELQWRAFLDNPGRRRWNFGTGRVNKYDPPGPTPEEQRKIDFPNLEPDQFWFVFRASGYEPDLLAWVAAMNDAESPNFNPVNWAAASAKLDFAKFFERDHPFIEDARQAIGMSVAELDALWQFAPG